MQAINHTGILLCVLNYSDVSVAIVVSRNCAVQHSKGNDFSAFKLHNFVTILCFTAISVVHMLLLLKT